MIYLHGGPAQQETWDPKPSGPSPERGQFGAIATSVPGVCFSELLPRSARLMHQIAVIRQIRCPSVPSRRTLDEPSHMVSFRSAKDSRSFLLTPRVPFCRGARAFQAFPPQEREALAERQVLTVRRSEMRRSVSAVSSRHAVS